MAQREIRIVWFIDSLSVGGAQKHLVQIASGLSRLGYKIWVVCLNDHASQRYLQPLAEAGVDVTVVGKRRFFSGALLTTLLPEIIYFRPQALFAMLFVSTLTARFVNAVMALPLVVCLQARNINYGPARKTLLMATASSEEWTFSNSRAALAFAVGNEGANPCRSIVVPNVIEPFDGKRAEDWNTIDPRLNHFSFVIGSVGRLVNQKGFDILIDSFARLALRRNDTCLVIMGEGPERTSLQRQIDGLGMTNRIFLPGEISDVVQVLGLLSLYIQPSRFEGTPNALMEAMIAGVPSIATAVDGVIEILENGVHAVLVEPENRDALYAALHLMVRDGDARTRMATRAKSLMESHYSAKNALNVYICGLDKALNLKSEAV